MYVVQRKPAAARFARALLLPSLPFCVQPFYEPLPSRLRTQSPCHTGSKQATNVPRLLPPLHGRPSSTQLRQHQQWQHQQRRHAPATAAVPPAARKPRLSAHHHHEQQHHRHDYLRRRRRRKRRAEQTRAPRQCSRESPDPSRASSASCRERFGLGGRGGHGGRTSSEVVG